MLNIKLLSHSSKSTVIMVCFVIPELESGNYSPLPNGLLLVSSKDTRRQESRWNLLLPISLLFRAQPSNGSLSHQQQLFSVSFFTLTETTSLYPSPTHHSSSALASIKSQLQPGPCSMLEGSHNPNLSQG